MLVKKHEKVVLRHCDDPKAFIEYSNDMDDIHENIDEFNLNNKLKILIVFNDMIVDIFSNKKLNPIVKELFIRSRN